MKFNRVPPKLFAGKKPFEKISFRKCYGYAINYRSEVSTNLQFEALQREGCCLIFEDAQTVKENMISRVQLSAAIKAMNYGDELIVTKLDRLGRTQAEAISVMKTLSSRGLYIRTLDGLIDTEKNQEYEKIINILLALEEIDKTAREDKHMMRVAKKRESGANLGGRPKTSYLKEKLVMKLREDGHSYRDIREQTGLALSTIRRIILES